MTNLYEMYEEDWNNWLASQPEPVRKVAASLAPNKLYRLGSGPRVIVIAYSEDGTVEVEVYGRFEPFTDQERMRGIDPSLLEECSAPDEKEKAQIATLSAIYGRHAAQRF